MNWQVRIVSLSALGLVFVVLFSKPAFARSFEVTGSAGGGCAQEGSFMPATLNVDAGEAVLVKVTIHDTGATAGWLIKGFPEDDVTILNNQSHTFSFTATGMGNFIFSGYWLSNPSCHKADGVVNVIQPTPTPSPTPIPTPEPTPSPSPTPIPTVEPAYPSSTPRPTAAPESKPVKPNNTGRNLIIGVIALVSLGAIGGGAWLLLKHPKVKP